VGQLCGIVGRQICLVAEFPFLGLGKGGPPHSRSSRGPLIRCQRAITLCRSLLARSSQGSQVYTGGEWKCQKESLPHD
jgi:hypothetical protein